MNLEQDVTTTAGEHAGTEEPSTRRTVAQRALRTAGRPEPWRRGPILTVLALLLGLVMVLHAEIPNAGWHLGSLVENLLPWLGLAVLPLLAAALWRRSAAAVVALFLPVTAWLTLFGGVLADKSGPGGDLTVAEQNVDADNPDPDGTARRLAASGADLLALVELTPQSAGAYEKGLVAAYPYHVVRGTVGLWSRLPLGDAQPIDVMDYGPLADTRPADGKAPENRALRTTVATARGPLTVYVAHLGSVRVLPSSGFWTASRDIGVQALGRAVAADGSERTLLLGDLNGSLDDRAFAGLTARMRSAQDTAGAGFGFSYPASFPVVRIDQILVRGVTATSSRVLPDTGSDHLPVAAGITW
ncbi:endonuclease/exonuclease/phosphatase family protein [Streptomyces sp. SP17BM10]|uniref:endonuclease/exonuclease/phosphatase family protein n=1 Tax=Streptomyces sp. SP17BM10 TaxID=3002530 RepID=UPI002E78F6A4|nr:endonuclease/exonuclease/phosphatase family protein [Streptomyces sp. SP17BM10]MEE1788622.1 endonuclease/exonuclease/phosphatase family protein [Streptomyces sp. SP17BM10]